MHTETVAQWGLASVYETRAEMNSACDLLLKTAKRLDIIAFGLRSFRRTQQEQIDRILSEGGDIRIITMKPGCDALFLREREEGIKRWALSYQIWSLFEWAKIVNSKGTPGKIKIRCHGNLPQDFLFLMDNRLFTGPYEYGKDSQSCLSFEYDACGRGYQYYHERFEALWNDPGFCKNVADTAERTFWQGLE